MGAGVIFRRPHVALVVALLATLLAMAGFAPAAAADPGDGSDDVATCLQSAWRVPVSESTRF